MKQGAVNRLELAAHARFRTPGEALSKDLNSSFVVTPADVAGIQGHRASRMRGSVRMAAGRIYTSAEMRDRRAHSALR